MARHPGSVEIDRAISEKEAMQILQPAVARRGADAPASGETERPVAKSAPAAAPPAQAAPIAPAVEGEQPAPAKNRLRRLLLASAGLLVLGAGAYFGWGYWTVGRFEVSTDDAYVQADNTTIAPKVSGYLATVLVGDNEPVKSGEVLARIDDRDYQVALDSAKADVAAAQAAIASKLAAIDAQQSAIDSAKATIAVDEANETFAEQENKRYADLAKTGYGSVQNAQQAGSRIAELAQAEAVLARDEAARRQAELNLSYATIVSPADGIVGNRTLRVGQYVQAGTQLMSVVPSADAYVVANFKETQLTDVHRGQPVDIAVDMFPGRVYHGHVDSLAPASGQTFALLPPDNATGNFTKVVQRIPVKVVLDPNSANSGDLRPGMSVTPTIDTKAPEGARKG
jgi:membrane fusion protein, multidrug efflux system